MIPTTIRSIYYAALLNGMPERDVDAISQIVSIHMRIAFESDIGTVSETEGPTRQDILDQLLKQLEEECSEI